jgi:hypothetical protein
MRTIPRLAFAAKQSSIQFVSKNSLSSSGKSVSFSLV